MSILDPLIDSLVALDRHDDAERAYDYSIRVAEAAYGKADLHVLRPLDRSAHWHERMGRYTTARILYARALQIAEQVGGSASIRTVEPLEGIARTYRLEFVNGGDPSESPVHRRSHAPAPELDPALANSQRLNPDGERAILLALQAIDKAQPVDHMRRGVALVELGDWYVSGGVLTGGRQAYREAWRDFELGGSTAALAAPRQLAYRPPLTSVTRAKGDRDNMDEHFVEASFTVTKDGRTSDVTYVRHRCDGVTAESRPGGDPEGALRAPAGERGTGGHSGREVSRAGAVEEDARSYAVCDARRPQFVDGLIDRDGFDLRRVRRGRGFVRSDRLVPGELLPGGLLRKLHQEFRRGVSHCTHGCLRQRLAA